MVASIAHFLTSQVRVEDQAEVDRGFVHKPHLSEEANDDAERDVRDERNASTGYVP